MVAGERPFDFTLDNGRGAKGFLLWRFGQNQGRAWSRAGQSDTAAQRSVEDVKYGRLPDEIEFAAVYNSFDGGFGHAYRTVGGSDTLHWSENMDTRFPNQAVHCQAFQLLPQAQYASTNINANYIIDVPLQGVDNPPPGTGAVLVAGKGHITSYTPTHLTTIGSMFDRIYEATGGGALNFGNRMAVFGSFSYIPNTDGSGFYRRGHNGTTYTLNSLQPAEVILNAGDRLAFFWKGSSAEHMRTVAAGADPMATASYSATINIGPGHLHVGDAVARDRQIFAGLPNGLHAGDTSGTFVNVLPELEAQIHEHNAADLCVYNTEIQVPHIAGLWSYLPSTFQANAREVGPSNRGDRSPVHGHIHAVAGLGPWLYSAMWTGSTSYMLAGRDYTDGSRRWHVMQRAPHGVNIHRIHFDGVTSASGGNRAIPQRLWAAGDKDLGATAPLYVMPVPRNNDNPLAPDPTFTANYCGSARMDFGRDNRGAPATPKVYRCVEVRSDLLLSGVRYADVYYTIDGGSRTYLGRANDSPRSKIWFTGVNGNFVTGHDIEISLESYTASVNISPIHYEVVVRGALRPQSVDEITAVVRVADGMKDRRGAPMRPAANIAADLRGFAGTVNPVRLSDLTGAGAWVLVRPNIEETEAYQAGQEVPETQMTVHMAVLDFTANTVSTWDMISTRTWTTVSNYTWAMVLNLPA